MKAISKVLAGICAFFFILSGAATLLLFNIERKAFSADTYKRAFKEEGIYAQSPALITSLMMRTGSAPVWMLMLDQTQMAFVISSLLPPAEMEAITNSALDSTFDFINKKSDVVSISLTPLKQSLAGEGGTRAFMQILQTQPTCTPEQILQMGLGLLTATDLKMCNPPPEVLQIAMPLIQEQITQISQGIPDALTLVTADQAEASAFRTRLNSIRIIIKLSVLLPIFLLVALTLFAVRTWKDLAKWWGISFLLTGSLTLLMTLLGTPLVRFVVERVILQNNSNLPAEISEVIQNVIGSLARQTLVPFAIEGFLLMGIGMGMITGLALYTHLKKTSNR